MKSLFKYYREGVSFLTGSKNCCSELMRRGVNGIVTSRNRDEMTNDTPSCSLKYFG